MTQKREDYTQHVTLIMFYLTGIHSNQLCNIFVTIAQLNTKCKITELVLILERMWKRIFRMLLRLDQVPVLGDLHCSIVYRIRQYGILNGQLTGPYILSPHLNTEQYLYFLRDVLFHFLESRIYGLCMMVFPVTIPISYGPVAWLARSPDLNPCDSFLWDHMNN
ncbi:hypothetical protein BDFB_009189 [Asbolus verrucosus]|uniref:Uncharacterized protein n=1 Tax=Asbolus verrucosus TaxID=1661398 RepID=A0A482VR89_ASBVE|nr:hypothetical protein BDFB_009189 [Asbolus verrucosus]